MPDLEFTKLEIEALLRFEELFGDDVPGFAAQLANARPTWRENTSTGFFTDIAIERFVAPSVVSPPGPFDGPVVQVGQMSGTLDLLLFVKDGYIHQLEGYSVGGESTASTDLVNAPFKFLAGVSSSHQTAQVLQQTPGGDRVLAWFGSRPEYRGHTEFGDFEVVAFNLQRGGKSSIKIALDGFPSFIFHFDDWLDVKVEGFSAQNVLGGLSLRWAQPRQLNAWEMGVGYEHPTVEMILEPCYGANGTIQGRLIKIDMIDPNKRT